MNILLCHNYYQSYGGEGEVFDNEAKGLFEMGEKVIIYSRQNVEIQQMKRIQKFQAGISAYSSRRTKREVLDLVNKHNIEVAIVQNVFPLISPSVYDALSQARIPTIQAVYNYRFVCPSAELFTKGAICERCVRGNTLHAVLHRCYRESYIESAWYATMIGAHRLLKTFSNKIDSFMVPDGFLGKKLAEGGIPYIKTWINPNPFFIRDYQPSPIHEGFVLFAGRLVPQKGILTLLKAMENTHPSSRLVIIGQGDLLERVRQEINSSDLSGRINLLGPIWGTELDDWIKRCAAVIIPSEWYDNLPMMLCKANAFGKPVIASRINGIPEYVFHGQTGFLFEMGNALELAGLIDEVLELPSQQYRSLSLNVRAFAEKTLDYPNHYRNLMREIRRLIDSGPVQSNSAMQQTKVEPDVR